MHTIATFIGTVFLGLASLFVGAHSPSFGALSTFLTVQGGTGTSSPSGILYGDNGATSHLNTVTIGTNLTFSGGTLSAAGGGGTFPFTPTAWGNSTSTTLGFLNGFISTASSTFSTLGTGAVYTQNGLIQSHATTSSSAASQDLWRDANQNAFAQNFVSAGTAFPTNGGTVTLTNASPRTWVFTGTNTQTMKLPSGTTLSVGATYTANNNSTGIVTVVDNGSNNLATVPSGGKAEFIIYDTSSANGLWDSHAFLGHSNVSGTNTLGIATTTPIATLSVNDQAGIRPFAVGSSTGNYFSIDQGGGYLLDESLLATSTSITLDWNNTGPQLDYQIDGSATTISIINATTTKQAGSRKLVLICNWGSTAGALTWAGVEWANATVPTQTTTANVCDTYSFFVTQATSTSASPVYKVFGAMTANFQ